MPEHYRRFWKFAVLFYAWGFLLHILAFASGLYFDGPPKGASDEKYWFGFISTAYWSIGYVTIVPFGIAAALTAHGELSHLGFMWSSKTRWVAVVAGTLLALVVVGMDGNRVFSSPAGEWVQWNHYYEYPESASLPTKAVRVAMLVVAYGAYGVGYVVFASMAACVFLFCAHSSSVAHIATDDERIRRFARLCRLLRICVMVLLCYFVLIRVSKIEMYFVATQKSVPDVKPMKFLEDAKSYIDRIDRGLGIDLALLITWFVICFIVHIRMVQVNITRAGEPTPSIASLDAGLAENALKSMGKRFQLISGLCMLGIVFPPPTRAFLLQICVGLAGAYLVKQSLSSEASD